MRASFDGSAVRLSFGIPRGLTGNDGQQGIQGIPRPPGEVSAAQLAGGIAGISNNANTVNTLDVPFANNPPTLADIEVLRARLNELRR